MGRGGEFHEKLQPAGHAFQRGRAPRQQIHDDIGQDNEQAELRHGTRHGRQQDPERGDRKKIDHGAADKQKLGAGDGHLQ